MGDNVNPQVSEQVKEKELTDYVKLQDYARKGSSFRTLNGKDVLWFAVQVPQGVSLVNMLDDLFDKYKRLIRWYDSFEQTDLDFVDNVCDNILKVLEKYLSGDVIKAYEVFSEVMDSYEGIFPYKDVEDDILFYRMRKELNISDKKEFYHLPTTMHDKCSSERFSIAGYPCFYIGYSKNDCYVEISKTGSMIGMKLNEEESLRVLDLTFSEDQKKGERLNDFLKAFPLIASCYVVFMNDVDTEKAKFREEYVIPQMLTSYLRHQNKYDGICYFSTRNENLEPLGRGENDYRNLVLFPKLNSTKEYDEELMNKFHWFKPFSVR